MSSCQITRLDGLATRGISRIPTEIANGGNIHVLDVPPVRRSLDSVKRRQPCQVPLPELDADVATASHARCFTEDFRTVVLEVAGKNGQALLELRPIHGLASRAILRSPLGGHRLQIAGIRGAEELLGRYLGRGTAGELTAVSLRSAGASREQEESGNFSE